MRTYRQCLVSLGASFAGKRLSAISAFDIERYKQARLKGGVRAMVNREREVLRAVYNRCREWGKYEGDNPAVRVKGVREDERRLRFLDADEEARLLAAATAPGLRAIILVGIHAGLRIESEVLTLTPGDLESWPLPRTPHVLETSLPGVFAVGDVRSGSMKRVASAVGEGSTAISLVHQALAE